MIYQLRPNAVVLESVFSLGETRLTKPLSNKGTHIASLCAALSDHVRPESENEQLLHKIKCHRIMFSNCIVNLIKSEMSVIIFNDVWMANVLEIIAKNKQQ